MYTIHKTKLLTLSFLSSSVRMSASFKRAVNSSASVKLVAFYLKQCIINNNHIEGGVIVQCIHK